MTHYCPKCGCILRPIVAKNYWSVHKICLRHNVIYACFDGLVAPCQTPQICAPLPVTLVDSLPPLRASMIADARAKGIL